MKLPSSVTTVTPFSKALALFVFIMLPFLGVWVGFQLGFDDGYLPGANSRLNLTSAVVVDTLPTAVPSVIENISPAVTAPAKVASVKLLPTDGWLPISTREFSIQAPPRLSSWVFSESDVGLFNSPKPGGTQYFSVKRRGQVAFGDRVQYRGGSRREWWLKEYAGDADHPPAYIFAEKKYGPVNGLEVSEGTTKLSILVSFGSRIYEFSDGSYGKDWSLLESIVSTFKYL